MTPTTAHEIFLLDWHGYRIEVRYAADWLDCGFTAHLELETVEPPRAPLPVTETGYRSHFHPRGTVEACGGPLAYAEQWLDREAAKSGWRAAETASRQLSLF